jgi:hypothetical protein
MEKQAAISRNHTVKPADSERKLVPDSQPNLDGGFDPDFVRQQHANQERLAHTHSDAYQHNSTDAHRNANQHNSTDAHGDTD